MRWRKQVGQIVLLVLVISMLTHGAAAQAFGEGEGINLAEPLKWIFAPFVNLFGDAGDLSVDQMVALTRFMLWIAVFAIFFGVMRMLGTGSQKWMTSNISVALAFVFATISAVFMPSELLLQVGITWGQVAFLILVGPIVALLLFVAIKFRNTSIVFSLAAWFMLFYVIAYFHQLYLIENPLGNHVDIPGFGAAAGLLTVVTKVASTIAGVAIIVQLVRLLGTLGGGQGGGVLDIGRLFGGGNNHPDPHDPHNPPPHNPPPHNPPPHNPPGQHVQIVITSPAAGTHLPANTDIDFEAEIVNGDGQIHWFARGIRQGTGTWHALHARATGHNGRVHTTHRFAQPGHYIIRFDVDDDHGNNHHQIDIHIDPAGPGNQLQIALNNPAHQSHHALNTPVAFEAAILHGRDPIHWHAQYQQVGTTNWHPLHARAVGHPNTTIPPFAHTFTQAGDYLIRFDIEDPDGHGTPAQALLHIDATNQLQIGINAPAAGSDHPVGQPIRFDAAIVHGVGPIHWQAQFEEAGTGNWQPLHARTAANNGPVHATHSFPNAGHYIVRFDVEDSHGPGQPGQIDIHIQPPAGAFRIKITHPPNGATIGPNQPVQFRAKIEHGQGHIEWAAEYQVAGQPGWHVIQHQTPGANGNLPPVVHPFPHPGDYLVRFKAIDGTNAPVSDDCVVHIVPGGGPGTPGTNFELIVNGQVYTGHPANVVLAGNRHALLIARNTGTRGAIRIQIDAEPQLIVQPGGNLPPLGPANDLGITVTRNPQVPLNPGQSFATVLVRAQTGTHTSQAVVHFRIR